MKRLFALIALLSLLLAGFSTITPDKVLGTQVIAQAHADEDGTDPDDPAQAEEDPAAGISHNLRVKNSTKGTRLFGICDHWDYQTGVSTASSCPNANLGTLSPGQNSLTKYGWPDTDAIQITKGYELREDIVGVDPLVSECWTGTYYRKVSPLPYDHYRSYYLKDTGGGGSDHC